MKTITLFMGTLFLLSSIHVFAQVEYKPKQNQYSPPQKEEPAKIKKTHTEPPKENIIKINLLSPIFSTLMLFYQHNTSEDNSFQIGVGYMNFDGFGNSGTSYYGTNSASNTHTEAFYITPEYRYTFAGSFMEGSFIAPFLRYSNMTYSADYYSSYPSTTADRFSFNYQTLGVGICVGQQYIYKNKVSIEVYAGPVYNMLISQTTPSGANYNTYSFGSNPIEIDKSIPNINIKNYSIRGGFTVGFLF